MAKGDTRGGGINILCAATSAVGAPVAAAGKGQVQVFSEDTHIDINVKKKLLAHESRPTHKNTLDMTFEEQRVLDTSPVP